MCQCPLSGLLHFYRLRDAVKEHGIICVNALHRAYSISTERYVYDRDSENVCQCPSSGLLHFYLQARLFVRNGHVVCQCLSSGLLHFYQQQKSDNSWKMIVSMPFIGLTPFLHLKDADLGASVEMCQCPSSGLLHFYNFLKIKHNNNRMCQCPSSGLLHFYGTLSEHA